jgi:hypothetical protein
MGDATSRWIPLYGRIELRFGFINN